MIGRLGAAATSASVPLPGGGTIAIPASTLGTGTGSAFGPDYLGPAAQAAGVGSGAPAGLGTRAAQVGGGMAQAASGAASTAASVAGAVAQNVTPWNAIVTAIGSFFGLGGAIAQAVAAGREAKTAKEIAALNLVAQQQATVQQAAILREQQRLALIQAAGAKLAPRAPAPPDLLRPAIVLGVAIVAISLLRRRE